MSRHTAPEDTTPCKNAPTTPQDAPNLTPQDVLTAPQSAPTAPQSAPTTQTTPHAQRDWYTDTLRAIVARALDSDKPDIKGALAALAMLAETEDTDTGEDIAHLVREARRRVALGKASTE